MFVCPVTKVFFLVTLIISSILDAIRIGLLGLLYPGLLFCFLALLLVFLSLLFNAPTRHTEQLNFYIYICILHNYTLILLVATHTHTHTC